MVSPVSLPVSPSTYCLLFASAIVFHSFCCVDFPPFCTTGKPKPKPKPRTVGRERRKRAPRNSLAFSVAFAACCSLLPLQQKDENFLFTAKRWQILHYFHHFFSLLFSPSFWSFFGSFN